MVMSIKPNDFFNQKPSDDVKHSKEPTKQNFDLLNTQNTEVKQQNLGWLAFLKKHQNFLLLQCVLLILIGVSFLFW